MRTGEVLALTWDDIDLEKQIIKVNKTVYAKKSDETGRWYLGKTKTINSNREIYISDTLLRAFQKYKERQEKLKKFYGRNYHYYHLEHINCRFYDLRGSYATKSLRNGVEIKDVAGILGHSNIETTENYYIFSSADNKKEATKTLESSIQSEVIDDIINNI